MPKNSQGSWVGTSVQPQYQTYQTAGMLRPATAPSAPPPAATTPTPDVPTGVPITDLSGINFNPIFGTNQEFTPQVQPPPVVDRAPLVDAVLQMQGFSRAPRARSNKL